MSEIRKKAWPEYFKEVASGKKTFDLRLADWKCQPGDVLVLVEWDPATKKPTGREIRRRVGFVGLTNDMDFFDKEEVQRHGYQIISLLPED